MNAFWQYARLMLRYRSAIALAALGLVIDTVCSMGGFASLIAVIKQFFKPNVTVHDQVVAWTQDEHVRAWLGDISGLAAWVPTSKFGGLALVMSFVILLALIGSLGRVLHTYCAYTITNLTILDLRKRVFQRMVHMPLPVIQRKNTSDNISRLVIDTRQLGAGFNMLTDRSVRNIMQGVAFLAVALWLDWKITLYFLVALPIAGVIIGVFGRKIRKATHRALRMGAIMLGAVQEVMQGIAVVKVHHAEGYERRRFHQINRRWYNETMRARVIRAIASPVIEVLAMLAVATVAMIAAYWVFQSAQPGAAENIVYVLLMLAGAAGALRPLTNLATNLQVAAAAAERIANVLALPVETRVRDDKRTNTPNLAPHRESVAFDAVSFTYPGNTDPALHRVSLEVPRGKVCAVVGGNGSGKSTLLSLIPRLFEPDEGRVLIDGVDIAARSLRSIRRQIAMVTQETVLFDGTVEDNIIYGARQVSHEQIIDAAKRAHAHEFIVELPHGYATPIGERGTRLSGGQRQRLAIARAILRNPAILILDEATSQIDSDSERKITDALAEFTRDRTTFVIAHRLSTVIDADMIAVMHAGEIVDLGTHTELLKRCDIYRILCRTQLQAVEEDAA